MSADGDIVRRVLETDDASFGHPDAITEEALAALARLEADREAAEALARKWLGKKRAAEAQRDALAEALRRVRDSQYHIDRAELARAALAEAGLE